MPCPATLAYPSAFGISTLAGTTPLVSNGTPRRYTPAGCALPVSVFTTQGRCGTLFGQPCRTDTVSQLRAGLNLPHDLERYLGTLDDSRAAPRVAAAFPVNNQ